MSGALNLEASQSAITRLLNRCTGREGNRNVQNFPRFGRGFVLRGDRKNEGGIISIENQCTLRGS